ncbi:MAG: cyanophycinase [Ginsengibacter sp.]
MRHLVVIYFILFCFHSNCQNLPPAKGKLFIIGGGSRSPALILQMIETANLTRKDHIAILPMATIEPDSSYYYIKSELEKVCDNTIANLNFTPDKLNNQQWLDSLKHSKLIFITGGDQSRFMKLVLKSPVHNAIYLAYKKGSTIAGTSAGAAVMSTHMITGNQLLSDTTYTATFNKLWNNNIEFAEGLGLLDSVIIDQHFIARSRYNRLLSALAKFPDYICLGIDESTAIIVDQNKVTVTGEGQVIKLCCPKRLPITKSNSLIKFQDALLSIYTSGDRFKLK